MKGRKREKRERKERKRERERERERKWEVHNVKRNLNPYYK